MYNEKFDLHASLSWTGWSSFDSLTVINNDRTTGTNSTTELDWKDTYFLAAGADYYFNEKIILRGGLSYETGAPPDEFRTPRGVDDDRMGLNVGATFSFSEMLAFHGAFTQLIFLDKPSIDLADPPQPLPGQGRLTGEYSTSASLFRLAVSAKF
jgi:long-chain fatty acid transport protein